MPGGLALGAAIEFGPGSPVERALVEAEPWLALEGGIFVRVLILACRRTRRLLSLGS